MASSSAYQGHQTLADEEKRKSEGLMDNQDEEDDLQVKKNFTHVRVLHNFQGENNDELCLNRDDVITLTQTPSGGWWEGTIDGITGWFPANYVTPIVLASGEENLAIEATGDGEAIGRYSDNVSNGSSSGGQQQQQNPIKKSSSRAGSIDYTSNADNLPEYRAIIIKDIRDSEAIFIQSLQDAITHYLMPLYQFKM